MSNIRKLSPVIAGLAVLAVPSISQLVQAQSLPIIEYGTQGPAVRVAETSLHQLGYYHGAIDGVFGPELLLAVKSFQGHYGLAQDGIVGPLTWQKLSATVDTPAPTTNHASPTFQNAAPEWHLGSVGPGVVQLQQLLNAHGAHLATDGDFGPLTYAALRLFQASHGLAVNGVATSQTMAQLKASSNSVSDPVQAPPPAYPPGYLHEGDHGPSIVTLQQDLTKLGYSTGGIDGQFGPMTLQAVQSFQRAHGLPSYGLVGAMTWHALDGVLSSPSPVSASPMQLSNRGSVSANQSAVVGIALRYNGSRYVFGGNTPQEGFDCSGLVQWVYRQIGISLPRTSFAQWDAGTHISESQLAPGDLVFFTTEGVFANHVGIYLGNGDFISAATPAQGVIIQSLSNPYFAQNFDGAVQVVPN